MTIVTDLNRFNESGESVYTNTINWDNSDIDFLAIKQIWEDDNSVFRQYDNKCVSDEYSISTFNKIHSKCWSYRAFDSEFNLIFSNELTVYYGNVNAKICPELGF